MTTIAVNKESMACDLQFTHGEVQKFKGKTKIYELPETSSQALFGQKKVLVGFAGNASTVGTCIEYLYMPQEFNKIPKVSNITMVSLNNKGEIHMSFDLRQWLRIDESFYAIGSGSTFALGALSAGKTPIEACRVAAKYDPWTGMGYKQLFIKQ